MRKTICFVFTVAVVWFCSASYAASVGGMWRYTTDAPEEGWNLPGFEENKNCPWKSGQAGFGRVGKPADRVKTPWKTPDIWMRTTYTPPKGLDLSKLSLEICHDEDFQVYINGKLAASGAGHRNTYALFAINPTARKAIKPGKNLIAVHCHQTVGGQFIDVALMDAMINLLVYDTQVAQTPVDTPRTVYAPSPTSDGYVIITPVSQKNFQQMADAMDHPEWKTDPRFQEVKERRKNWGGVTALIADWTSTRTAAMCEDILSAAGVPCSRYRTIAEAISDPQSIARGLMSKMSEADGGFLVPNPPFKFADNSVATIPTAPRLGEHTDEVISS